jgi:sugar phosphate isomerase/epimerase
MLRTGLNPYGLTYYLGLQGSGTAQANPNPAGLAGFLDIATELRVRSIELHAPWFAGFTERDFEDLNSRLQAAGYTVVLSLGPPLEHVDHALHACRKLGSRLLRLGLSPVLCGGRSALGENWNGLVRQARATLRRYAPLAAENGIRLAIEDHQDFGSQELVELASEAGPNVGITLDTGNPLAVGEDILSFVRRTASLVRHIHLKDYRVQWTKQGFRLVRCAIGDGCVPFDEICSVLGPALQGCTASLEPGALESRHIQLFQPEWWDLYPPRTAAELGACLACASRSTLALDEDCRTPWERESASGEIIEYELAMIRRSAKNMRAIGWMEE